MPFIHVSGEFEDRRNIIRLSQDNKSPTYTPIFTLTSNHKLRKLRTGSRAKRASIFVKSVNHSNVREMSLGYGRETYLSMVLCLG
jgi:hypothetical protein